MDTLGACPRHTATCDFTAMAFVPVALVQMYLYSQVRKIPEVKPVVT